MSCKIAFSSPTAHESENRILFEKFREIGYDGLQLKWSQYAPYLEEPARFVETWGHLPGAGSALIAAGVLDKSDIEQLRKVINFGAKIGSELVVYCHLIPRMEVDSDSIRKYAVILNELGQEAKELGVKLSLHHHYDQPVMYRQDFDLFFDAIPEPNVGLTIDTAHLVKSGITDAAEVIRSFHHVIDNFHMKDFANGDWKVLGEGDIDFRPIFLAIRDIGYNGWISADEESGGDLLAGMKVCYSYIRDLL